jgi:hypothetical protein
MILLLEVKTEIGTGGDSIALITSNKRHKIRTLSRDAN